MITPIRVLYVDDAPAERELVRVALASEPGGFQLTEAASAAEFKERLAAGGQDVVLAEWNVPGLDGFEVLDAVRARGRHVPVILVTRADSAETATEAFKRGAADYLLKTPEQLQFLPHVIRSALEQKQLERDRAEALHSLNKAQGELERRIQERTDELGRANQVLRAVMTERERSQELLQALSAATASVTGERFFKVLAEQLARFLHVRYVFFLQHLDKPVTRVRTLAYWSGDHLTADVEYAVADGPCAAAAREPTFHPRGLRELYPRDTILVDLGAESYCGLPLTARNGRIVGHLAILDTRPMERNVSDMLVLQIFIARAAAELERQEHEESLRRSEARFRELLHALPDAMFLLDRAGTYLDIKPARDFQLYRSAADSLGKNLTAVLPSDVAAGCLEHIHHCLETGQLEIYEYALPFDGGARQFEARLLPAEQDQVVAIVRDVSEKRLAEERTRQLEADLSHALRRATMGEMATELAHELTQPLSAINVYAAACANQLRAAQLNPEGLQATLEAISTQAMRAGELIHRIRRFLSRNEPQRRAVVLNDLVDEVLDLDANGLRRARVEVRRSFAADLPAVWVDPIQIQQVLLNLVRNAQEAMMANGDDPRVLAIRTSVENNQVRLAVRDTGGGLDPAIAARLFEAYQTTKRDGLGMGLAISRSLIEAHGGRLWAEEPNEGRGMTFQFTLPLGERPPV